jgi:hypothetical protein
VFKQIHNTLSTSSIPRENDYIYGKRFIKPPKILAEIVIGAFRKLEIDYSIKSIIEISRSRLLFGVHLLSKNIPHLQTT